MIVKYIIEHYLGEKSEEFAEWAFGPDFKTIPQHDLLIKWNELHGDKLLLDGSGKPEGDIPRMIEIWGEVLVMTEKCSFCGEDLRKLNRSITDYCLLLRAAELPNTTGVSIDVFVVPPIDKDHWFCGMGCLSKWIDKQKETSEKKTTKHLPDYPLNMRSTQYPDG